MRFYGDGFIGSFELYSRAGAGEQAIAYEGRHAAILLAIGIFATFWQTNGLFSHGLLSRHRNAN